MGFTTTSQIGVIGVAGAAFGIFLIAMALFFFLGVLNQARHVIEDEHEPPSDSDPEDLV